MRSTSLVGRPWKAAALWCAVLAILFFSTYSASNWLTAQRHDVGVWVFDWERYIPFVPWTIVPYWSIDLLYGASLFLCVTRRELSQHVARLLCAQGICIAGFLLVPLRFSFERPETSGFFGLMFNTLAGFDKPFNQAPSLHIALLVVLWRHYARHLPNNGVLRVFCHAWFALIGVSVLTTYQHHFIDLVTGLWAGMLCLFIVSDMGARWRWGRWREEPKRVRMAGYYALASALMSGLAWGVTSLILSALMVWTAGALLLVTLIYLFGEGAHFGKQLGRQTLWLRALLAPYLLGARLNVWLWTRRLTPAVEIAGRVWLGRMPFQRSELARADFVGVLDLSAELACPLGTQHYAGMALLDLLPPSLSELREGADKQEVLCVVCGDGKELTCCALGFSRSAAVVAAWLVCYRGMSVDQAIRTIAARRSQIVLNAVLVKRLEVLAEARSL